MPPTPISASSSGCGWILEIGFNNFVDHGVATGPMRGVVDNSVWGLDALLILAGSWVRSLRTRQFASALRVGLWSGLVSGLIAYVMGLLLVIACLRCLLRDPLNVQEYVVRGVAEHATDMATYFAYDTMVGALGHLLILGLAMGVLFGASAASSRNCGASSGADHDAPPLPAEISF